MKKVFSFFLNLSHAVLTRETGAEWESEGHMAATQPVRACQEGAGSACGPFIFYRQIIFIIVFTHDRLVDSEAFFLVALWFVESEKGHWD